MPGSINIRCGIFNTLFKLACVADIAAEKLMIIEKVMKVYLRVEFPKQQKQVRPSIPLKPLT